MQILRIICGVIAALVALFAGGCSILLLSDGAGGEYGLGALALFLLVIAVAAGLAGWLLLRRRD